MTDICGGIISIPIIFLIFVLFLLQFIQLVTKGIVYSSTQNNSSYEPPASTFTTSSNDSSYSPFMVGFSITNDDLCSDPISLEANVNLYNGAYSSANRTNIKVPIKL